MLLGEEPPHLEADPEGQEAWATHDALDLGGRRADVPPLDPRRHGVPAVRKSWIWRVRTWTCCRFEPAIVLISFT